MIVQIPTERKHGIEMTSRGWKFPDESKLRPFGFAADRKARDKSK